MRVIVLTMFALFFSHAFSQAQQFTLDNGLKIVVKEDHRAPVAVSMVWYNVGSADEPGGITGISHALEHFMFKGTKKHPLGIFSKTIASIGGEVNAFTSYDYTAFFENIAASHLATTFELEADRMQNLLFDEHEFAKEIQVIQEERRLRTDDNPQVLTLERFLAAAHLSTPYHHPIVGWMSDLKRMNINDIKAWYQRFYAPNNATLVVVGDVTADNVYKLAQKYFGKIKPRAQINRKPQSEQLALGKKMLNVHVPAQLPMLMMGYPVPSIKTAFKKEAMDPYALEIIDNILSAIDSGRFSKELIRNKQIASSTDIYYNLYARYPTQFILYGTPGHSHTIEALKKGILAEIKRLQIDPVSENELQRIKIQMIAQKTFERDSILFQATELGLLETVGLGWQTADKYIERINQVTAQQLQQTAQRYFQKDFVTEARLIPVQQHGEKQ